MILLGLFVSVTCGCGHYQQFAGLGSSHTENLFVFVSETFHPMTALSQYLKCNFDIRAKQ